MVISVDSVLSNNYSPSGHAAVIRNRFRLLGNEMYLYNQWYLAAWNDAVGHEPVQRWLLDIPVMFYRTEAGTVIAMEDRCPHRLVPLSKGRLVGDQIQCVYHGATFAPDGKCVFMPGSSEQARTNGVRTFAVIEQWNAIWIWMGEREAADPALLPPADRLLQEGRRTVRGVLPCRANYQLCVDNLLDLSHEAYLHPHTIGTLEVAEVPVKTRVEGNRITVSRVMHDVEVPQLFARARNITTNIDRHQTVTGHLPTFVTVDVKATPVGTPDIEDPLEWQVLFFMTPERAGSTHYFFALSRSFGLDSDEIDEALIQGALKTLYEDIDMLEAQQEMLAESPLESRSLHSRYDAAPDRARAMMADLLESEAGTR